MTFAKLYYLLPRWQHGMGLFARLLLYVAILNRFKLIDYIIGCYKQIILNKYHNFNNVNVTRVIGSDEDRLCTVGVSEGQVVG